MWVDEGAKTASCRGRTAAAAEAAAALVRERMADICDRAAHWQRCRPGTAAVASFWRSGPAAAAENAKPHAAGAADREVDKADVPIPPDFTPAYVGELIGCGGSNVRAIRHRTGASVLVDEKNCVALVTGGNAQQAANMLREQIADLSARLAAARDRRLRSSPPAEVRTAAIARRIASDRSPSMRTSRILLRPELMQFKPELRLRRRPTSWCRRRPRTAAGGRSASPRTAARPGP